MNANSDRKKIPACRLAGVMTKIITRIRELWAKAGTQKRILLQMMDAKSKFWQVGITSGRAAAFAYWLMILIFADIRSQFGRRESPGCWEVGNKRNTGSSSGEDMGIGGYVDVVGATGKAVEPFLPGCGVPMVQGRGEKDPTWVVISVEVRWSKNGARCKALTRTHISGDGGERGGG